MLVSLKWIKRFLSNKFDDEEIFSKIEKSGIEIDEISSFGNLSKGIIFAKVISCNKIKESNKLQIAEVFDGNDTHTVICGAPNCKEGIIVAFAKIGSMLSDNGSKFKITKRKILSYYSYGMLCSSYELGIGNESDSIIEITNKDELIGLPVRDYVKDTILNLSFTPNIDRHSSFGVAQLIDITSAYPILNTKLYSISGDILKSVRELPSDKLHSSSLILKNIKYDLSFDSFLYSVFCKSLNIESDPSLAIARITGVFCDMKDNFITEKNTSNSNIENYSSCVKKIISKESFPKITSIAIQMFARINNLDIDIVNLKKTYYSKSKINIDRLYNLLAYKMSKEDIVNIISSKIGDITNSILKIPSYLNEYVEDSSLITGLIAKYIDFSKNKDKSIDKINNIYVQSKEHDASIALIKKLTNIGASQIISNPICLDGSISLQSSNSINILNRQNSKLRTSLLESMLTCIKNNIDLTENIKWKNNILFEIGKTFNLENGKAIEKNKLIIVDIVSSKNIDYKEALSKFKNFIKELFISFNIHINIENSKVNYNLHPYIQGDIIVKENKIGNFGKISDNLVKDISNNINISCVEIDLDLILNLLNPYLKLNYCKNEFVDINIVKPSCCNSQEAANYLKDLLLKNNILYNNIDLIDKFYEKETVKYTFKIFFSKEKEQILEFIKNNNF